MEERKTTSIKVNPDLWKETKKLAIDRGIEVSELVEGALRKELQKR
jgi:post-segregation antitoxin (ccd killing protein)